MTGSTIEFFRLTHIHKDDGIAGYEAPLQFTRLDPRWLTGAKPPK